jgi:predicted kinase
MAGPRLIVLSGLPGAGKSTVAEGVARALHAPILSVDPIEAAMWRGGMQHGLSGVAAYGVAAALAEEQLALGLTTVIDAVNPVEAPRRLWRGLAHRYGATLAVIEVVCSDLAVHRRRVEARKRNMDGVPDLTWSRVEQRRAEFEPWRDLRLVLDSSELDEDAMIQRALDHLAHLKG